MSDPFIGEIRLLAFPRIPVGWLACDGSKVSISEYQPLFSLLGTTYGGDGVKTFGLPDLRGQVPLHQGTGQNLTPRKLGDSGGTENVTLSLSTMPTHTHPFTATSTEANAATPSSSVQLGALSGGDMMYAASITGITPRATSASSTSTAGGNQAHENTMPTLTVSFCIAAMGLFPVRP
jgi:microcystin-dependent protein